MSSYLVYLHVRLDNGKPFYIGKGKNNRHLSKHGRNKYWHNIVSKHDYDIIVLEDNLSSCDSCNREIYWIDRIGRKDLNKGPLVNMTDGGDGLSGSIRSENSKLYGKLNPFYGKTHSEETRKKISESNKRRIWKEESILKMSEKRKGVSIHSDESKLMRSINISGEKNFMYGKTHSDEAKIKMSKKRKYKTLGTGKLILDLETGIYYNSILEASRFKCINKVTLQAIFAGKFKNKTSLIDCSHE
jgi:hypothetical protein